MTIEGNWIGGAMSADFPDVDYTVAELPQGPAGPGTLAFTNCWGIAEASGNKDDAVDLVEYLTSEDQQLAFADAFGVIPSRRVGGRAVPAGPPGLRAVRRRRRLRAEPALGAGRRRRDRRLQRPARGPEGRRPGGRSWRRSRTSCRRRSRRTSSDPARLRDQPGPHPRRLAVRRPGGGGPRACSWRCRC